MFQFLQKKLRNNDGMSYITVVIALVCLLMIFSVVLTFADAVINIRQQKDLAKLELDNFTTKYGKAIVMNLARANNNINSPTVWRGIDRASYLRNLKITSNLQGEDGYFYSYNSKGGVNYYISAPTVTCAKEEQTLDFVVTYTIFVPLRFMGEISSTARVNMVVTSRLYGDSYNTRTTTTVPATEAGG